MSSTNGNILEFFTKIPKLEADGSNWVIYKDRFLFAAAAASLSEHIDGTGVPPTPVAIPTGTESLTDDRQESLDNYTVKMSIWKSNEAIIRQGIVSTIPDSLFLEVRKEVTAFKMWEAVKEKREKKSQMVTVDLWCKLQAEKCAESRDMRAHLHKLQAMCKDLTLMGGIIDDEDFMSVILGSIPQSYNIYIATIMAMSSLMDKTLLSTNLIDTIRDEVDRWTIKNPKSKKGEHDMAYVAGQTSGKGKKDGEDSKKSKKNVRCYNCKNMGHIAKDCWVKGGGAEGQGPKGK